MNNHEPEPWRYHKPFTHKFYKKRDPHGTWLLDMKDYGRAMKCVNALSGIKKPEGFMKLIRSMVDDMDETHCTCGAESEAGSDYSYQTVVCYYHELKGALLPTNKEPSNG